MKQFLQRGRILVCNTIIYSFVDFHPMVRGEGLQARIFSHRFESVSVQRWLVGHLWTFFIPSGRILGNESRSWSN